MLGYVFVTHNMLKAQPIASFYICVLLKKICVSLSVFLLNDECSYTIAGWLITNHPVHVNSVVALMHWEPSHSRWLYASETQLDKWKQGCPFFRLIKRKRILQTHTATHRKRINGILALHCTTWPPATHLKIWNLVAQCPLRQSAVSWWRHIIHCLKTYKGKKKMALRF